MSTPGTIAVILNVLAGTGHGERLAQTLADSFLAAAATAHIVAADPRRDDLTALARRAAVDGARAVVAAGGDGTVSSVAAGLAGTGTPLGVIPAGTLNHFAKDLRIPLPAANAVRTIVEAHATSVDVGEVNGHIFINNSSLGLYPQLVQSRLRYQRGGHRKWVAFLLASFDGLRRYSFVKVHLTAGARTLVRRTPLVFIGNNRYELTTLTAGTRKSLAEGHLSLYVTHQKRPVELLALAARALAGRLTPGRDLDVLCAREILIHTRTRTVSVATDGEVQRMRMPLRYRIRPAELRVIVPAETGRAVS
jgi:diacylglycerol kinase family enzyme